jgi:hypothetical protein
MRGFRVISEDSKQSKAAWQSGMVLVEQQLHAYSGVLHTATWGTPMA